MNKKTKITIVSVFIALIVAVGCIAGILNYREKNAGNKNFTLEIISERDDYSSSEAYKSNAETLGEFLRQQDFVAFEESDYGMFLTSLYGMEQDLDEQYWWCITVNDEASTLGVDSLPLEEGSKYTLTLLKGY